MQTSQGKNICQRQMLFLLLHHGLELIHVNGSCAHALYSTNFPSEPGHLHFLPQRLQFAAFLMAFIRDFCKILLLSEFVRVFFSSLKVLPHSIGWVPLSVSHGAPSKPRSLATGHPLPALPRVVAPKLLRNETGRQRVAAVLRVRNVA